MEENKVNEKEAKKEAKKGNVIKFFLGLSKKAKIIINLKFKEYQIIMMKAFMF